MTDTHLPCGRALAWIRDAEPADAHRLHLLSQPFVASNDLRRRPATAFSDGIADFVAAEYQGRVVGCAGVSLLADSPGDAVLYNLCVEQDFQGLGLGAELVAASVRHAARSGARLLYTATTRTDGWFERYAFRRVAPAGAPPSWVAGLDPARCALLYARPVP